MHIKSVPFLFILMLDIFKIALGKCILGPGHHFSFSILIHLFTFTGLF